MPRAKKNRPAPDPRLCAFPGCTNQFRSYVAVRRYCDDHMNRHAKQQQDRRKLGAKERPPGYYKPKKCQDCGQPFDPRTGSARYCDACQGTDHWAKTNPDKARAVARKAGRRLRHKLAWGDPDIYEKLVELYGEQCGVCAGTPDEGFHLAIDHNHETGIVRGLLCSVHNTGLGYFQEDPALLRAAAAYLERPPL